ncbi:MAG TPA: TIGR03557 family F420-dependent LLM class oxidoreductase [Solirubrobacterales bacterium]|nr:TIGR03557 family F420-dependent LLM class oxidoreductase [Solirubrobacterales bacterium]
MAAIGYTLSSEEFGPRELVGFARRAEEVGFDFLSISDHFHPWVDRQGSSPFVWAVIGGLAEATERIEVTTGVTCPTTRIHPAIVAQAAATAAVMLPGRFSLGVGSGENLNEHILGDPWPETAVRQERLEEAIEVVRKLWRGGLQSHRGRHYTVQNARLYTLPEEPPPILVAGAGPKATALAGRVGDGFFGLVPDREVVQVFEDAGGEGKPSYGQVHVCWAADEAAAKRTALAWWPNAVVSGALNWELPLPSMFEDASSWASEDDVAEAVVCGPDPERIVDAIREFVDAGYDHVYFHQVGPDQEGFLDFAAEELLPRLADAQAAAGRTGG